MLGVEPKNGSTDSTGWGTGRPVVLIRSSIGQGMSKSFSLSQWPSLPGRGDSLPGRGPAEAQRSPAKHLMLTASQPIDP